MAAEVQGYSPIGLRLEPELASRLPELARGRALVIDYFASGRCGATVGDLTVSFVESPPGEDYLELEPLGAVPVFAERALLAVLARGATLRLAGLPFAQHLALTLDEPERWLDFLEHNPRHRRG